jgi:transcriptional regulator with XRE-family HTH domain
VSGYQWPWACDGSLVLVFTITITKLENDEVKRPSPVVLQRLGEVLGVPYVDLMALVGYHVPGAEEPDGARLHAALFADLSDDERDELLEYLAWYRARKRSRQRGGRSPGDEG